MNLLTLKTMYRSFDTHDIIKSFVKSGMKAELAETVVKAIANSRDTDLSHLATKADLVKVENKLEKQISEVRSELYAEIIKVKAELSVNIEKAKNEVLRWVIGLNIATISAVAAMFKFFIH